MDDNIEPSDPYISKEHDQSDLLKYQMANPNQLVPGYQDDSEEDDLDDGLAQNQSSFIPSGKEYLDSSLSDSNVGFEQEEDMLLDPSRGQGDDLVIQGQTNPFQPDLLKMNPLSLESKSGHADNIFAPNDLSKMPSAQLGFEEYTPSSQTPDLLMMDSSSPVHSGKSDVLEETVKQSCDTEFKSAEESNLQIQNVLHGKQEAIENDFYNADEKMDNYDDEYVDSEESDYSDYSDEKDENETGLEQIVPELKEKQHSELKTENENIFNNDIDPNVAASGLSMKEGDFSKNVQFDENIVHSQFSDEENGNIADKTNQPNFADAESVDYLKQEAPGSVTGGNENVPVIDSSSTIAREENVESVETRMDDTEMKPAEAEGIPKSSTFTIESDNSDFEERSLTPVHNPLENMQGGPMFQDFAVGHSEGQGQIKDLMGGTLMDESEDSDDLDDEEIEDIDTRHMEQQTDNTNPFQMGSYSTNTGEQSMLNPETVQNNQSDLQQSQSFGDQLSDNVDTFSNKDQNPSYVESVDNAEVPFQQYQTLGEKSSEDMNYPYDASFVQQQSQFSDEQQLLDNTKKPSDNIDMDNEIVEDKYDDFAEISKLEQQPLQSQDQESLIIDTSKEMIKDSESEEMNIEKSFQQTTELEISSDAQMGAMMNPYEISKLEQQPLQSQDRESLIIDTSKEMIKDSESEEMNIEKSFQQTTELETSSDAQMGAMMNPYEISKLEQQPLQSQDQESLIIDTSKEMIKDSESEEMNIEKSFQQTTELETSSDAQMGAMMNPYDIQNQILEHNMEDFSKTELDTEKTEQCMSETKPSDLDMLGQGQVDSSESEDETYGEEIQSQSKESGMAGSIVLDEGESFNDEKNEQEMDESISSEEEVDSPNKDPISSQLKQSLTEEMNQEREITDKTQVSEVSPDNLETLSQARVSENENEDSIVIDEGVTFEGQASESNKLEIEQLSSVEASTANQMKDTGIEGSQVLDDRETTVDKSNEPEFEPLSPGVSPVDEILTNQMRESGMEGSFVLDEGQTFEDKHFENEEDEFVQSNPDSPDDEIPANQMRESGMEGSFVLDEGETFEDKKFENDEKEFVQSTPEVSPEDEIPTNQMRESGMEGSFVLDDGQTFDDKQFANNEEEFVQSTPEVSPEDEIPANQMRESGMEGSFVFDEGKTFDDKQFENNEEEFVQSTPEVSPEDEIPTNQMRESGMEGSFVLDEGETFDDKQFANNEEEFVQSTPEVSPEDEIPANQMRESGMEGSFVFDEGKTFDDKQFENNEEEFVQSTPEVSPEDEIPANQMRESGMEGSFVLDEGETFEDKQFENDEKEFVQSTPEVSPEDEIPANQMRESGMEGSFVFDEGETFDDKQFASNEEEFVQSTPEISPEDEIPANQMRESGMEGSIVLDEGETFDTKTDNLNKNRVMEATPYDNELPCEQGLPGVPGVDESNVIGDDDKEYEYHEKKDSFSSEEESTQKDHESTNDMKESGMGGSIVLDDGQTFDEGIETNETSNEKEHAYSIPSDEFAIKPEIEGTSGLAEKEVTENKLEESVDTGTLDTPVDSYAEEGDVDSAIQSPFSQDGMIQSPSSDVNAAIYVEHENEKNLMSSSLIEESFGLNQGETNETYQSCLQNGISHSTSEEVTPEKEEAKPVCYQNGISQSASEEFTPEKEAKLTDFDTIKNDEQKVPDGKLEEKDFVSNTEVKKELESKKISFDVKKVEKESSKKTTKLSKPEIKKKDITKETKKIPKDNTMKKDTLSKLPSPTKLTTEKRSVSASRVTTVPPTRTTKSTTRMPRDTTRKPRPTTTNEPTKSTQIKQRPKSIDISRTSSLTRPTASSLNKSRTFEKSAMEGASSPTKPMRSLPKTAPSRYRITKSKKDGSSDSGVEEDKSPRKIDTPKKSPEDKGTTRSTSAKRSTIPTMNKTPTKSEGSPKKTTGKTTPTNRTAQSKIGSLDNSKHTPGGGQVKIQSKRTDFSNVNSKIGSRAHMDHKPAGGEKKIHTQKLEWKAESKVGSLKNATHSPGGGKVKIQTEKLSWNVQSKVGSLDNATHSPGGGHVKIANHESINWKAESRVGSLVNAGHVPGGGNVHIPDQKLTWRAEPRVGSLANAGHVPGGGNFHVPEYTINNWNTHSKVDSLSNNHYSPGGGDVKIENKKLDFKDKAQSKVGSKDHMTHKPGGGDKKIESQKLNFKDKAQSKVGSKDNMDHKPLGGDKKIDTQKLTFKESAKPRTNSGVSTGKTRPDSGIECEKTEASV